MRILRRMVPISPSLARWPIVPSRWPKALNLIRVVRPPLPPLSSTCIGAGGRKWPSRNRPGVRVLIIQTSLINSAFIGNVPPPNSETASSLALLERTRLRLPWTSGRL